MLVFFAVTLLARIILRILADRHLMDFYTFIDNWCIGDGVFCVIDLFTEIITFHRQLDTKFYIKRT